LPPEREANSCTQCGVTLRERIILGTVLTELGFSLDYLFSGPLDMSVRGIGIGDNYRVGNALGRVFRYTNTYLDEFPILDLEGTVPSIQELSFVSCSDVLEHVISFPKALEGLASLLNGGAVGVVSIPIFLPSGTTEKYPDMKEFSTDGHVVEWQDSRGIRHLDHSPSFHGGDARTLEMRLLSFDSLVEAASRVGLVASHAQLIRPDFGLFDLGEHYGWPLPAGVFVVRAGSVVAGEGVPE
jgi:hypothetical protein